LQAPRNICQSSCQATRSERRLDLSRHVCVRSEKKTIFLFYVAYSQVDETSARVYGTESICFHLAVSPGVAWESNTIIHRLQQTKLNIYSYHVKIIYIIYIKFIIHTVITKFFFKDLN